jgi:structural maintenance of chromosome 2
MPQGDFAAAEKKLQAERAVLVRFDNELADLDRDLAAKRQEIVECELVLKKAEHDVGLVAKERAAAVGTRELLEKQFTWIQDEHQ